MTTPGTELVRADAFRPGDRIQVLDHCYLVKAVHPETYHIRLILDDGQDHEAALAREWRPIFPHGMTLHRVTEAQ